MEKIVETNLDESFLEIFDGIPSLLPLLIQDGIYLGGGLLRTLLSDTESLSPNKTDIDFFFNHPTKVDLAKSILEVNPDNKKIFQCPENKLATYVNTVDGWKIQLVSVDYYPDVETMLSSFDFTVTMFGTDGNSLWMGENSFDHTLDKELVWNKITYPASSLRRMMKYSQKGYHMVENEYQKFVQACWEHNSDIRDEKLVYVD